MRIEQLECVAAVIRLGSMRRASEALHLSQPALSQTISNLERELGVSLLDRHRSGARISTSGRELLPWITEVLDAVHRLREAADEQMHSKRVLRVGTVNAATVSLVSPAIGEFRHAHPETQVELIYSQQQHIHQELLDGVLDIGLINVMSGDDLSPDLETIELLQGRAVVCCRSDHPLADLKVVPIERIFAEPFIAMRSGYLMYRYAHRLLGDAVDSFAYSADGAEMGKLMVAEGLGVTVLPDYSVVGDPLERQGIIVTRPIDTDDAAVTLVAQRRRARHRPEALRRFAEILIERAADYRSQQEQRRAS
jgi:DNA-binding transcriptional LysR family regulator